MPMTYLLEVIEKDCASKHIKLRAHLLDYKPQYLSFDIFNASFISLIFDLNSFKNPIRDKIANLIFNKKRSDYLINEMVLSDEIIEDVKRSSIYNYSPDMDINYFIDIVENKDIIKQRKDLLFADFDIYFTDSIYFEHLEVGDLWTNLLLNMQPSFIDKKYQTELPLIKLSHRKIELSKHCKHVEFSKDSKYLFLINSENLLSAYTIGKWSNVWYEFISESLTFDAIHEDSEKEIVWLQNQDKVVAIFNRNTGEILQYADIISDHIVSCKGKHFAYINSNNSIDIKDNKKNILFNIPCEQKPIDCFFNAEEKLFAFYFKNSITIWNIALKKELCNFQFDENINHASFAVKNNFISICLEGKNAQIFHLESKDLIFELPRQVHRNDSFIYSANWTNNNKYFCIIRRFNYGDELVVFPMKMNKNYIPLAEEIKDLKSEARLFNSQLEEAHKLLRSLPIENMDILYYIQETYRYLPKKDDFYWNKLSKEFSKIGFKAEAQKCLDFISSKVEI